jgi:hypothetical protein
MTSRSVRFAILYEKNGGNMLPKVSKIAKLRGVPELTLIGGGESMWRRGFRRTIQI